MRRCTGKLPHIASFLSSSSFRPCLFCSQAQRQLCCDAVPVTCLAPLKKTFHGDSHCRANLPTFLRCSSPLSRSSQATPDTPDTPFPSLFLKNAHRKECSLGTSISNAVFLVFFFNFVFRARFSASCKIHRFFLFWIFETSLLCLSGT